MSNTQVFTTPTLLYRVWSQSSNGSNSAKEFRPASNNSNNLLSTPSKRGSQLQSALRGDLFECPFVFFTSSLLFALVFAAFRQDLHETGIVISCIDTRTALTDGNERVRFRSVGELTHEWDVPVRPNSDGSRRTYSGEWVAMSPVIMGEGSCSVSFDTLVQNGLYSLYPAMEEVRKCGRKGPKLYIAISKMRGYGFSKHFPLSDCEIKTAASLTMMFQPCVPGDELLATKKRLLASFLAFQKRESSNDPVLEKWVQSHSAEGSSYINRGTGVERSVETEMPETIQCQQLAAIFLKRQITIPSPSASIPSINSATARAEKSEFEAWVRRNSQDRRASRVDRPPRDQPYERGGERARLRHGGTRRQRVDRVSKDYSLGNHQQQRKRVRGFDREESRSRFDKRRRI